ncbi:MAG: glycosyltransferase family 2 protein [Cyclobacteriaceae bacterium]|nr:glycosyltransferase family 2 protein [Cyclobacteriaceae bacterium]
MELSVIISVFNEEENIGPLIEGIDKSLCGIEHEVIFINDGSTDGTVEKIRDHAGERYKILSFYKNYGQTAAMAAGIDYAKGTLIVTMDGDLQNDPGDIPAMMKELVEGKWDVVAGRRVNRRDSFIIRKIPSKIANWVIRKLTGVYISDYGCSLKIFKAEMAKSLGLYGELHRFIPVLAQLQGARMTEMDVSHHRRIHGKTKYGLGRTFRVMSDILLMVFFQKYMQRPMHLFGTLGIFTFGTGMLLNLYLLFEKILGHDIWGRPVLILAITLTIGGIQLITSGLIAEVIMRTYYESQDKKTYSIKEIILGNHK